MAHGPRKTRSDFGDKPELDPDPGFIGSFPIAALAVCI